MFILANLIVAVATILKTALTIYMWIIFARAVISWVSPDPYNPIVRFLIKATDPVLDRVRRLLPAMGGLDLSPLLVMLAIMFLQYFLVASLFDLANRLKFGFGG